MAWWANVGIVAGTLLTIGGLIVLVVKVIAWIYGRTTGQRLDGLAAEIREHRAEVRAYRRDQVSWQRWHEEGWHGYPPAPTWHPNGTGPTPSPALDSAVRSHRR